MSETPEGMFGWAESIMRELAYRRGFEMGLVTGLFVGVVATSIVCALLIRWTAICLTPRKKKIEGGE